MATNVEEAGTAAPAKPRIGAYAWYALAVLVLVYIVNFVDRQILSILQPEIKLGLGVTDTEMGFLYGTAFAVFYALFGIPLGRLADSWYRGRLMAMGLVLWSSMTVLSGFASTFAMLAVARIGVGIGEASASPAAYSMISDSFPKERRATALSIYSSGLYIGGALSLLIGGLVASRWRAAWPNPADAPLGLAGWQATFLVVGVPGLLLALWVLTLREPPRGAMDGAPAPVVRPNAWRDFGKELFAILPPFTLFNVARIPGALVPNLAALGVIALVGFGLYRLTGDWPQWLAYSIGVYAVFSWIQSIKHRDLPLYKLIWGSPVVVVLIAAFGSISFVTYATSYFIPAYVETHFYGSGQAAARYIAGFTAKEEVGFIIAWTAAVSAAAGVILGGYLSDLWRQRSPNGRLYVNMLSTLLPIPLVAFLLTTDSLAAFYWVNPVAHLFASAWVGAAVATLQDLVLPRMRGTAGATYILGTTMVGLALGPYFAGKMSVVTGGLATGIAALYFMPVLTLIGLWIGSKHIARLEATKVERARAAGEPI
ncbi:MAG TPA: MFS transporter [Allosphingosinicella sp.]|nr:MFS transporter [Allosphingosinicella sp.]